MKTIFTLFGKEIKPKEMSLKMLKEAYVKLDADLFDVHQKHTEEKTGLIIDFLSEIRSEIKERTCGTMPKCNNAEGCDTCEYNYARN